MNNEQVLLVEYPKGIPQDDTLRCENIDIVDPRENRIQIESLHTPIGPHMRKRMTQAGSYVEPFEIGEPTQNHIVSKITRSNSEGSNRDDITMGMLSWRHINTVSEEKVNKVSNIDAPLYLYLNTLGVTDQAAYHDLLEIGQSRGGGTVIVSATPGVVGAVVGQTAKIKGARVVGIAGGGKEVNHLTEESGFGVGIDYKKDDSVEALTKAVLNGIGVYFEDVGGIIADEVMGHLNRYARVPVCDTISNYNNTEQEKGPRAQSTLVKRRALVCGFLVVGFAGNSERVSKELATWIQEGEIKTKVSIEGGPKRLLRALGNLFTGENFGKQVVKASENA